MKGVPQGSYIRPLFPSDWRLVSNHTAANAADDGVLSAGLVYDVLLNYQLAGEQLFLLLRTSQDFEGTPWYATRARRERERRGRVDDPRIETHRNTSLETKKKNRHMQKRSKIEARRVTRRGRSDAPVGITRAAYDGHANLAGLYIARPSKRYTGW
eukprot:2564082-Pyramimonas_sp.AAC.1